MNKSDEESVKRKLEQTEFIDQQRQSSKKSKLSEDLENNVPLAHVPMSIEQVVEPLPKITRCDVRIKKEDLSTYYCDILGSDKPQDNSNAAELSEKEFAAIGFVPPGNRFHSISKHHYHSRCSFSEKRTG